jgi:hypothetical protein
MKNNNNRKKAAATLLVGALLAGIGGSVFANLNETIQTAPDAQKISNEGVDAFGFAWHAAKTDINADISITDDMAFNRQTSNLVVENIGDIPGQFVMFADPATVPVLAADNPIWDQAYVLVHIPTETGVVDTWAGTVREFTQTAFVTNRILKPGEADAVTIEILPPTTYTYDAETAAQAASINFGMNTTFNQLTDPTTSPLYAYALANGEQRGGVLDPDMNIYFRDEVKSGMTMAYTLPVADVAGIKL